MSDLDKIVQGAIALGFEAQGNDTYLCTREQLLMLCAIVAQQTEKQVRNEQDNKVV